MSGVMSRADILFPVNKRDVCIKFIVNVFNGSSLALQSVANVIELIPI